MDLQEKDAYIAEHLMKLEPDTLRFMVADLTSEVQRLTQLCKEQGRKLVAEKVFSETSEVGVEFAEDAVARTQKELESERAERLHWFKRVKENESALTLHAEEKALMVAQMAGLDKAELAAALERVGESVKLIDEIDREYNQKTNALIERHAAQLDQLKRERDECRDTLELREQERDQWHAPCCTMEMRAIKAYRQGFETCREAAAIAADEYAEKCMLYDETDGIEKEAIGCVIRALPVPERGQG